MEAADLFLAYMRRTRFEAQILASELAKVMFGAGAPPPPNSGNGRPHQRYERIPADQMLRECGVTL